VSTRLAPRHLVVVLAVLVAGIGLSGCTAQPKPGTVKGTGNVTSVYSIKVGDCVNDKHAEGDISTVPKVSCAAAHDSEAYESIRMPDGDFPGDDAVKTAAVTGCQAAFATFTGIAYNDSTQLDFSWYHPTDASWAKGDREILCLVQSLDENQKPIQTIGTLKDANR
jgi:hypothetical protein